MDNKTKRKRGTVLSLALALTAVGTFFLGAANMASASDGGSNGGTPNGGAPDGGSGSGSDGVKPGQCTHAGKGYDDGACVACPDGKQQRCSGGSAPKWGFCFTECGGA
jgi:hypothetical protein